MVRGAVHGRRAPLKGFLHRHARLGTSFAGAGGLRRDRGVLPLSLYQKRGGQVPRDKRKGRKLLHREKGTSLKLDLGECLKRKKLVRERRGKGERTRAKRRSLSVLREGAALSKLTMRKGGKICSREGRKMK